MAERETVVVEGDRRPSYGWLIALVVILLLIILFFVFGGMELFSGMGGETETINLEAPETVEVQPTTPQQ
jgi:hypothetical protein